MIKFKFLVVLIFLLVSQAIATASDKICACFFMATFKNSNQGITHVGSFTLDGKYNGCTYNQTNNLKLKVKKSI